MEATPHLIIYSAQGDRRISLAKGSSWTVGRGKDNTIVIDDTWASRNHAIIQIMESGSYYLIDLGSSNGTFVNGKRVNIPVVLKSRDRITFGTTESQIFYQLAIDMVKDVSLEDEEIDTTKLHQRRLITVLVIDIRDFTKLTLTMDENLLSQVIDKWLERAAVIINRYGSRVDNYIGDAIMAVWVHNNVQVPSEGNLSSNETNIYKIAFQEILQVFNALLALYKMTDALNSEFNLPQKLRIGAGVNTGKATVGQLGSGHRPEYTALGDVVNSTFRLESATKEINMDVALGEGTFIHCPDTELMAFTQFLVNLKGYDAPTNIYGCTFANLEASLKQLNN